MHKVVHTSFAGTPLRELKAPQVKGWYDGLPYGRTAEKLLMIVRAIFTHALSRGWIDQDPTAAIERQQVRYSGDYDFYSREEIDALAWAAASEQDAAIYLTAAMTGLRRGELVALRWRDVDFPGQAIRVRANYSFGQLVTPKSGKVRTVPMVPDVAQALARLSKRELFTRDEDPAFAGPAGGHLDASALRRRYTAAVKRAGLRPLPFHSLRHYFGSMAVNRASLVHVQSWMGHSHIQNHSPLPARQKPSGRRRHARRRVRGPYRPGPRRPGRRGGVKYREIVRLIEDDGWRLSAQRGSHRQYEHPTKPGKVTIAGQPNKDVPKGTAANILRQAGLPRPKQ